MMVLTSLGYFRVSVISIVDTFLAAPPLSPSRGGISSVPMDILPTLMSFMNRLLVISAASTAVVMACPRAFNVSSLVSDVLKLVIIPIT